MRLPSPRSVLTTAVSLVLVGSATAQVNDYVLNGDFETGTLDGWNRTSTNPGTDGWIPNDGTPFLFGVGGGVPPQNGLYDATAESPGPGIWTMTQCFIVPNTIVSATIAWTDEIRNYAGSFQDPIQEFRVYIADLNGNQIGPEIFSTNAGDPLFQPTTMRSFDLTTTLQGLAGQSVCLVFQQEDTLFAQHTSVDDVSLLIDSPDPVRRLTSASVTINAAACVPGPGANNSVLFTPDGAGGYNTTPNGGVSDPNFNTGTPIAFTDDSTNVLTIGFPFTMPGGTVLTSIEVDSNGRAFEPGAEFSDFTESVGELLNDLTSVIAPFWDDLNPGAGGQIWQSVGPGGEFVVTWENVPQFGTTDSNTFQMVLSQNGSVTFNYFGVDSVDGLVGLSAGNGAADPGSSDLSAGPIATAGVSEIYELFTGNNDFGTVQLLPSLINNSLPVLGQPFNVQIVDGPGSVGDFYLLGNPTSFDLNPLGIPCFLQTDGILATISTPVGSGYTLNTPNLPSLSGQSLNMQGAILDPSAGNPFFVLFTNSIDFTFGNF